MHGPGVRIRQHGNTYEVWPRQSTAEGNLANLLLPINLDTSPSGIGPNNYGPRPLYPHMHLLPTYETLVVSTKCAPLSSCSACILGFFFWCVFVSDIRLLNGLSIHRELSYGKAASRLVRAHHCRIPSICLMLYP